MQPVRVQALIVDAGVPSLGHRTQLLATDSFFANDREIGVGYAYNTSSTYWHYWAIHTAYVNSSDVFLTGVVYNDANHDGLYSLNEGLGGVTVTAGNISTVTNAAGGWSIQVKGGATYNVTVGGGGFTGTTNVSATVGNANVEVDFVSGQRGGIVNFVPVAAVNHPPVLTAVPNQTVYRGQTTLALTLSATDPDGDALTYSAQAVNPTYQIAQQFGLRYAGSYYTNLWGKGEKWLLGTGNTWYWLMPNGQLQHYGDGTVVATLDPSYYADPSLLYNASPTVPVTAGITGHQLSLTWAAGFTGTFVVRVSASDRIASDVKTFTVSVINRAPTLTALANQTIPRGQNTLALTLSVSNPGNVPLSFTTQVVDSGYQLGQQLGLQYAGSYYTNRWGRGEKWLLGSGGTWYWLMPNGQLIRYGDWAVMATFDPSYYADPSRLYNASHSLPVSALISGNKLTLTRTAGLTGKFIVRITVSDGVSTDTKSFTVTL